MDKILRWCAANGYNESDLYPGKATKYFTSDTIRIQVGRSNFMSRGRITKDEEIFWSVKQSTVGRTRTPQRVAKQGAGHLIAMVEHRFFRGCFDLSSLSTGA